MFILLLKILFESSNPVNSYDKTNLTVFVLSLWEKDGWGLNSFGQYIYISFIGRYEYMTIQTDQQKPVPMTFVNSKQWVKPSDWPVGFCKQPIEWKHVRKAGEISNNVRACEMAGTAECFRYVNAKKCDQLILS